MSQFTGRTSSDEVGRKQREDAEHTRCIAVINEFLKQFEALNEKVSKTERDTKKTKQICELLLEATKKNDKTPDSVVQDYRAVKSPNEITGAGEPTSTLEEPLGSDANEEASQDDETVPFYYLSSPYNENAFTGSSDLELELEHDSILIDEEKSSDALPDYNSEERNELVPEDIYLGNELEGDDLFCIETTKYEEECERFFDATEIVPTHPNYENNFEDGITKNDEEDMEYFSASDGEDEDTESESKPERSFHYLNSEGRCEHQSTTWRGERPIDENMKFHIINEDAFMSLETVQRRNDLLLFDNNSDGNAVVKFNVAPRDCMLSCDIKSKKGAISKYIQKASQTKIGQREAHIASPREQLHNRSTLQTRITGTEILTTRKVTINCEWYQNLLIQCNLMRHSCNENTKSLTKDLLTSNPSASHALDTESAQHTRCVIVKTVQNGRFNFQMLIQNTDGKYGFQAFPNTIEIIGLSLENIRSLVMLLDKALHRKRLQRQLIGKARKPCTGQQTVFLTTTRQHTIADDRVPCGDLCPAKVHVCAFVRKTQVVLYEETVLDRQPLSHKNDPISTCDRQCGIYQMLRNNPQVSECYIMDGAQLYNGHVENGLHVDEPEQTIKMYGLSITYEDGKEGTVVFSPFLVGGKSIDFMKIYQNVATLLLKSPSEEATRWSRLTVFSQSLETISQTRATEDEYKRFLNGTLSTTKQKYDIMEILVKQPECRSLTKLNDGLFFSDEKSYFTKTKSVLSNVSKLQTSPSPKHPSIAKNKKSDGECPGKVCYPKETRDRAEETMTGRKRDTANSNKYRIDISMINHINDVDRDTRAPIIRTSLQNEGQVVHESFLSTPESVVNRYVNSSNVEEALSQAVFFPKGGGGQMDEYTTYNLQLVCHMSYDATYDRKGRVIVVELIGFSTETKRSLVLVFDGAPHGTVLQQHFIEYLKKLCTFQNTELLITTRQRTIADDRVPYEDVCLAEISACGFVLKIQIMVYQETIWDGQTPASANDSMSPCIQLDNRFNNHPKQDINNQASTCILDGSHLCSGRAKERPQMDEADQRMSDHGLLCTIRDGKESTIVPRALTVKEEISISVETYINVPTLLLKPPMEDATKWSRITIYPRGFNVISQSRATRDKRKHCDEARAMSPTTQMLDKMRNQPEYTIGAKLSDHVWFFGGESQFTVKSVLHSMSKPHNDRTHLPKVKNQTSGDEWHRKVRHQPKPTEDCEEDKMKVLKRHASNSKRYGIENSINILKKVDKNAHVPIMRESTHIGDNPMSEYFLLAPESVENRHGNSPNEENSLSPSCFLQKEFKELYKDTASNSQLVCHMTCEAKHSDTCSDKQQDDFFNGDKSFDASISESGPEDIVNAKEMSKQSLSYKLPGHNRKQRKQMCSQQKTITQPLEIRVRMNDQPQQTLASNHQCQQLVITGDTSLKSAIQLGDNNKLLIVDTAKCEVDELFEENFSTEEWTDDSSGLLLFHEDFKSKPPDTVCIKKSRNMITPCRSTLYDKDCVQMIYPVWDKRLGSLLYLLRLSMSHRGVFATEWTEKIASPDQKTQPDLVIKDKTVRLHLRGRIMKGRPPRLYLQLGSDNHFGLNKRFIKNLTERSLFIPYDHHLGNKPTSYPFIQMTQSLGLFNLVGHRGYKQLLKFNIKFGEQMMKILYNIALQKAASGYTCSSQANNKKTCRSFKGFDSIADGSNFSVQSYYDRIGNDIEPDSLSGDSCGNYDIPFADSHRYMTAENNRALTMNSDATHCGVGTYCNDCDLSLETRVSPKRLQRRSAWEDTLVSQDCADLEFEKFDTFLEECVSYDGCSPSRDTHKTGDAITLSYIERQASAIYSEILERSTKEITKTLQESESFAELLAFLGAQICHVSDSGTLFLCSDNLLGVIEKLKDTEQYIHELLFVILEGKELVEGENINEKLSFIPEFELWNEN